MLLEILRIIFGGFCVGLASSVTVGPVAVLCIQRTLSKGHLSGLLSGLGIACADTLLAILAFTVYALLKSYIDEYNIAIQICGGIFVVVVGIFIFFKNPVPQIRKNRTGTSHLWQDFGSMFGFTMANFVVIIPYILAFFTMFNISLTGDVEMQSVEVVSSEQQINAQDSTMLNYADATQLSDGTAVETEIVKTTTMTKPSRFIGMVRSSLIILGFLLGAVVWWAVLTFVISLFRRGFRPRHMLTLNRIAGIVISTLGLYTLLSVLIR